MILQIEAFSGDKLADVKDFACGTDIWAVYATRWISQEIPFRGALWSMETYGTKVWLYYLPVEVMNERHLVGFASLGTAAWSVPDSNDPKRPVMFVPMLAVATIFQGKPRGPAEQRYSHRIMKDIIDKARVEQSPDLCLYVHPQNTRAIRFYERCGFRCIGGLDQHGNQRMHRLLD